MEKKLLFVRGKSFTSLPISLNTRLPNEKSSKRVKLPGVRVNRGDHRKERFPGRL